MISELPASDYTNLWHRFKDLELEIPESEDEVVAAVDATGVKVMDRGEWLRKYHKGKRRGWIKVHVAVDAESKELLLIEVTTKGPETRRSSGTSSRTWTSTTVWRTELMTRKKFSNSWRKKESTRRRGSNSGKRSDRSFAGGKAAKEFQEFGYEEWKEKHEHGKRRSVEGFFSATKRCFGETVRAASPEEMIREVKRKFALYNLVTKI